MTKSLNGGIAQILKFARYTAVDLEIGERLATSLLLQAAAAAYTDEVKDKKNVDSFMTMAGASYEVEQAFRGKRQP